MFAYEYSLGMNNIMTVIDIRSDNVGVYLFSNNFILLIELLHVMFFVRGV